MKYSPSTLSISLSLILAATSSSTIAANKTVRLLQINDLHAHLTPHADRVVDNGVTTIEERGGIARLATLLKQQRAENPDNIVMNIGDTFHGGAEALFSMGNAIVEPVNALNIDIGVAGNWDFAYSPGVSRMRFGPIDIFGLLQQPDLPSDQFNFALPDNDLLASNDLEIFEDSHPDAFKIGYPEEASNTEGFKIEYPGGYLDEPFPILRPNYTNLGANVTDIFVPFWDFMPATEMIDVNGVKVGFIGLTSDIVEDMHVFMALGFSFTKGEDNYRQLINQHASTLRTQGADIVVVMSELGIHKDNKLAQIIEPGSVDVIFSAHTHEATKTALTSTSGALVVEAGNDGWLGQMDITVDDSNNIINRKWNLLAIDDSLAEDTDMKALVDVARAPYLADDVKLLAPPFMLQHIDQPINTVIGHTDTTVDRKDALESTFNAGWTDKLRQLTGTDAAISPGFRMDTTLVEPGYLYEDNTVATGDITLEDAYRLFPVVYLLAVGEIDGAGLRQVMEDQLTSAFSSNVFNHNGGWTSGISGVDITLDLAGEDGSRISAMSYSNGDTVQDSDILKVGGCMRIIDTPNRLCSIPGFSGVLPIKDPGNKPYWTALDAFVYALGAENFNGSRVSITDESATPRWPEDDFIQPINGVGTTSFDNNDDSIVSRFKDKTQSVSDNSNASENDSFAAGAFGHVTIMTLLGLMLVRRKAAAIK